MDAAFDKVLENTTPSKDSENEKGITLVRKKLSEIVNLMDSDYERLSSSGELSLKQFWKENHPRIKAIEDEKLFKKILSPKNYTDLNIYVAAISTLLESIDQADKIGDKEEFSVKTNQVKVKIDELISLLKENENKTVTTVINESVDTEEKRKKKQKKIVSGSVFAGIILSIVLIYFFTQNQAPTAFAGENLIKKEGEYVVLNGNKSSDPEHKQLTYQWKQINGTKLEIPDKELNKESIRFKLPDNLAKNITFTFELVVSDDKNRKSESSLVQVTAENIKRIPEYKFETVLEKQEDSDPYILDFTISYEIPNGKVILLSDFNNKNIFKISSWNEHDRRYLPLSGQYSLSFPVFINSDSNGNIYVYDPYNAKILRFDLNNSTNVDNWNQTKYPHVNFTGMGDIAIDRNNNVYVIDMINDTILKFNNNGTYIPEWGSFNSQFNSLYNDIFSYFSELPDIAIDSNNNVYVTNIKDNKILKFNNNGTYIPEWGSNKVIENFSNIADIATDSQGNIYVADNDRIQKLDSEGNPKNWSSLRNSSLIVADPEIIKIDYNDKLYSFNRINDSIKIFDTKGKYLNELVYNSRDLTSKTFSGFNGPAIIKSDSKGFLYAIDMGNCYRFVPPSNNSTQYSISQFNFNCGMIESPDLSIDPSNNSIYISDLNGISKYDVQKEAKLTRFSSKGKDTADPLVGVRSIAVSSDKYVFVSDQGNNRIIKYDDNLIFIKEQKHSNSNIDFLDRPGSITIDSNDNVYVYEQGKNRIIKYDRDLNFKDQFDLSNYNFTTNNSGLYDIDTYSDLLYISSFHNKQNKILIVDTLSKEFKVFGKTGIPKGFFNGLTSIDVDKTGNIYVADSINDRIQKMIPTS